MSETSAETTVPAQIEAAGHAALDAYESIPYENDLTHAQVWSRMGVAALAAATPLIEAQVRERVFADLAAEAHSLRAAKREDETQTAFWIRQVQASVMSDAARIALYGV